ncbi:hypothetical protein N7E81_13570 [Reichenbachiella carrageenanivorans]|uniref:ATP10 protein n=1 Tax=Reichenbachiella carrageenanivorans TaxID=2979869 RepID=A0ABY6CWV0_9BACT|nr:hypothetical protein [Reichenbachiella carrageenanivorans]UXX78385.1 hypothetical protein N7E81_13570 [Reichenbachiella carrageenanivorans]
MKIIALLFGLLFTFSSYAQESNAIGSIFPDMEAEGVDSLVKLPEHIKGKYSIIGLAYNKKSGERMPDWIAPIYQKFIMEPGGLMIGYDVNTYFVYMFSGVKVAMKDVVKSKMIAEMDPVLLPHTLFETGDLKKYQTFLDMLGRKDTPYFFVLDPEGKILWATRGTCRESKINKLASYIDDEK